MQSADRPPATVAWIESPFQLVSLIEAAHAGRLRLPVRAFLRGRPAAYDAVLEMLAERPVAGVTWEFRSNVRSVLRAAIRADEVAIADLFSGQAAVLWLGARSANVVVLDDGTSTLSALGRLMSERAALIRPRSRTTRCRMVLARVAHRSLRRRLPDRLRVVTGLPVRHSIRLAAVDVVRHDFAWSRAAAVPWGLPDADIVILGSALAVDGLISQEHYDEWIERQFETRRDRSVVYFPHRRDRGASLAVVRRLGGVVASANGLPIELVAGGLAPGTHIATLPSTTVLTLPTVAPHVSVECWDVPSNWWTPDAPLPMRELLSTVSAWHHRRLGGTLEPLSGRG